MYIKNLFVFSALLLASSGSGYAMQPSPEEKTPALSRTAPTSSETALIQKEIEESKQNLKGFEAKQKEDYEAFKKSKEEIRKGYRNALEREKKTLEDLRKFSGPDAEKQKAKMIAEITGFETRIQEFEKRSEIEDAQLRDEQKLRLKAAQADHAAYIKELEGLL